MVYWNSPEKDGVSAGILQLLNDDPKKLNAEKIKKIIVFSGLPAKGIYRVINVAAKKEDKS